jgi:hypothetical protein
MLPVFLAFSMPVGQPALLQAQSGEPRSSQSPQLIPRTREENELRDQIRHRIVLSIRVSDASGKPSTELQQTDFTLLDDQKPQKIVSFRSVPS